MKTLYYMTQYASYMSDAAYYESMASQVEALDADLLHELVYELAPKVSDIYNKALFDILYTIRDEQLQDLVDIWQDLADGDYESVCNTLDLIDAIDADSMAYTEDDLREIADMDLRENGVDANALYWINEIDSNYNYFVFNGYANGFYEYNTYNDYLEDYITDDMINEALKDYFI